MANPTANPAVGARTATCSVLQRACNSSGVPYNMCHVVLAHHTMLVCLWLTVRACVRNHGAVMLAVWRCTGPPALRRACRAVHGHSHQHLVQATHVGKVRHKGGVHSSQSAAAHRFAVATCGFTQRFFAVEQKTKEQVVLPVRKSRYTELQGEVHKLIAATRFQSSRSSCQVAGFGHCQACPRARQMPQTADGAANAAAFLRRTSS